jgi:hypothetical protein
VKSTKKDGENDTIIVMYFGEQQDIFLQPEIITNEE